ncbi:pirin family protein [Sphaerisporangium aureirubrum]|uniref:Pirin family protein n=1 Tax=Sphaerisporangium aureirubrum TaxID=1544736 RepID=A0ABW1N8P4_9ACTN
MTTQATSVTRTVDRVEAKTALGPDAQVDDKAIIIAPNNPARTDPFLVLAEDWFSSPGFEWHPHRGMETVTTVVDGVLEHGDNAGHVGALESGDVQWMTAGRGIIHRELAYRNEHAHTLQLWLNLPARSKMVDTRYQDLLGKARPVVTTTPGVRVDVVSGAAAGVQGPALNHWPITAVIVTLEPGTSLEHVIPAAHRAFAYVLQGEAAIAGRRAVAGEIAWSDPVSRDGGDSVLRIDARDRERVTKLMVYSGQPIREPIAMGGPFVMNSRVEITKAFEDFHGGKFGDVPRFARLKYR